MLYLIIIRFKTLKTLTFFLIKSVVAGKANILNDLRRDCTSL